MKNRKMPETHDMNPNVTPLINIVMCLIIFYMLVAKIGVSTGRMEEMILPKSDIGQIMKDPGNAVTLNVLEPEAANMPPIVKALDETGELNKIPLLMEKDGKTIYPLRRQLEQVGKDPRTGKMSDEFKVIIRANENIEYKYLQPVLVECANAGVRTLDFAARMPE